MTDNWYNRDDTILAQQTQTHRIGTIWPNGTIIPRYIDVLEIPLTARPQIATIWLGDNELMLRLYWLKPAGCWVIDIMDVEYNLIAAGIALVTGADLFEQFQYTVLRGGRLVVMSTDRPPETIPGWGDLGVTGHVFWRRRPDERRRVWTEFPEYWQAFPTSGSDGSMVARLALDYRQVNQRRQV